MNREQAKEILDETVVKPNVDVERVKVEQINTVKNTVNVNGYEMPVYRIKLYGSQTKDLMKSEYAKKTGKPALYGGHGKFTPSKRHSVNAIASVEIDGTTWYFGLSKSGISEGT